MLQATLHQLAVFETAARHRSFTRAAEELYITQPTVSSQIKQLGQTVGFPLFEKIGKRLYLTEVGKELLIACQDVFTRLEDFEKKVADLKGTKQGRLRLAAITTTKYFIPRLLGSFCQLYPGIDVSLTITNHQQIQRRILENEDDLYFLSKLPEELNLHAEPFLENPLVVVARKDHPLAGKPNLPIDCLNHQPFILREQGSGTRLAVQELFVQHQISVSVKLELGSNEAIKQAVASGLGISVLSQQTLGFEGATGELTVLDIQHFPIERYWYVAYLAGKQLSIIAQAFRAYLLKDTHNLIASSLVAIKR